MASAGIRVRSTADGYVRVINHPEENKTPGKMVALDRLFGELVSAFFAAMAFIWVVTTVASSFR
jgi:hypothetical protein